MKPESFRRSRVLTGALAALVLAATGAEAQGLPRRVEVTPIRGNASMLRPDVLVANLDAGDLVAGNTIWIGGGDVSGSYVGFLARPGARTQVFEIPLSVYRDPNIHFPRAIADDGTVVGSNVFPGGTNQTHPFRWTEATGFELLPLPAGSSLMPWHGWASAVSSDGRIIAGMVRPHLFADDSAARWVDGGLQVIGGASRSEALDLSADGTVIVGENGARGRAQATRWVDGVEVGLETQGLPFSTARFVSEDGSTVIGSASLAGEVLVRWTEDGAVTTVYIPPNGLSVAVLNAIDADATTVVGALTDGGDQSPFVWRLGSGFRVLGELGGDYDLSEAVDVSDDGRRVVGTLRSSRTSDRTPPPTAVLWTGGHTVPLDALLIAAGEPARGLHTSHAISGDGRRILATGVRRPRPQDTAAVLIELVRGRDAAAATVRWPPFGAHELEVARTEGFTIGVHSPPSSCGSPSTYPRPCSLR